MKPCTHCNQQSPDDANFCHQCGTPFEAAPKAETSTDEQHIGDQHADEQQTGEQQSEEQQHDEQPASPPPPNEEAVWRQFIGPNADHYLETFKKFSANGQPKFALSWNWPAFLYISFLWFLYRKMYLHAFVYAVGPMVSTYLTGDVSAGIVWSIMAGATANYLYYWHCLEQISRIKQAGRLEPTVLQESGGVQLYVIWVGVAFYILFFITLVKMGQEGPPGMDGQPTKSDRPPAMTGV